MSLMADYTKSGGISTAKARRKDSAYRNKAHGLATRGRTKQRLNENGEETGQPDLKDLVPEARQAKPRTYVMVEHRRRDTGAVIWALDLTAPDAPDERVLPVRNDDGVQLDYAAVCTTHQSPPSPVATAPQARKEAKWSHKWCEGCRADQARTPATRSKAESKTRTKPGNSKASSTASKASKASTASTASTASKARRNA
jgi:hypothetical protein